MQLISTHLQYIEVELDKLIQLNDELGKISIARDINTKDKYYKLEGTDISTIQKKQNLKEKGIETVFINITETVLKHLIEKYPERYSDKYIDTRVVELSPEELKPGVFLRTDIYNDKNKKIVPKWTKLNSSKISIIREEGTKDNIEVFIPDKIDLFNFKNEVVESKTSIMIVDDQKFITHSLEISLEELDFKVIACNKSSEVIRLMRLMKPDLLLLDINMPGMNGFEVLKEINLFSFLKNTPVLMLTARRQKQDVVDAIKLGASDYLIKPIDLQTILFKIQKFLPAGKFSNEALKMIENEDVNNLKNYTDSDIEELLSRLNE